MISDCLRSICGGANNRIRRFNALKLLVVRKERRCRERMTEGSVRQ